MPDACSETDRWTPTYEEDLIFYTLSHHQLVRKLVYLTGAVRAGGLQQCSASSMPNGATSYG